MSPEQLLDGAHDRESFFDFISALVAERRADAIAERAQPSSPYGPTQGR